MNCDICMYYIYLISLIITFSYCQDINHMICSNDECIVNCDYQYSCNSTIINCPSHINNCIINCNADYACYNTQINCPLNNHSNCYINGYGYWPYRYATIS